MKDEALLAVLLVASNHLPASLLSPELYLLERRLGEVVEGGLALSLAAEGRCVVAERDGAVGRRAAGVVGRDDGGRLHGGRVRLHRDGVRSMSVVVMSIRRGRVPSVCLGQDGQRDEMWVCGRGSQLGPRARGHGTGILAANHGANRSW
jgi:hypothetical protein